MNLKPLYNAREAQERMNRLGAERRPFLFVVDYRATKAYVEPFDEVNGDEILFDFNGVTNVTSAPPDMLPASPVWKTFPEPFKSYERAFETVRRNLFAGNSFLVNLTRCTPVDTNLGLKDLFLHSKALYKLWVKDSFTLFSPEIFVRMAQGRIASHPMKGTIDAAYPDAERILMDDTKEAAEHATIVDLIRNDLSMVASAVSVSRYRYVDRLETNRGAILQTSSEIVGELPSDYADRLGDVFFPLLPAGSITGAPKIKTMQIIDEAEGYERGFYTGVMGCFDGERLDSAVMIRFVEQIDGRLYFKSGGGITCRSDAMSEYEEVIRKIYVPVDVY